MPPQIDLPRRGLFLLLLFSVLIWFGPLDYRKLIKPDEGRYAEIAREMVVSGDWRTPRLNGIKYFEKPPLQYWATAAAFEIFGPKAWAARLWTALTGFLTILVVWWAGRRFFGPSAGLYAGLVCASNLYFIGLGHVSTLDMGLTLFTTLALVGFCAAQRTDTGENERKRAMLVTWGAMGLAVLSKGLIGIVLPAATLMLYTLFTREWALLRRLYLAPGLVVFFALAAPWFAAVSLKNPEFPWFFFVHEHLLRYSTNEARREGPIYYFVPILLAGMLPWVLVTLDAFWRYFRSRPSMGETRGRVMLVLVIWSIFIFVFFSFSGSKLPAYLLPLFPALALLTGERLAALDSRQLLWRLVPIALIVASGFYFIVDALSDQDDPDYLVLLQNYSHWLYAALAVMVLGLAWSCFLAGRNQKRGAILGLAIAGLIAGQLIVCGHESMAPLHSAYALVKQIAPYVGEKTPFYSLKMYDYTLPFYLRRAVTLADYRDEFDYGLKQEPGLAIPTLDAFKTRWLQDNDALAIMQPNWYETLRQQGLPMAVIVSDGSRVVVRKPGDSK